MEKSEPKAKMWWICRWVCEYQNATILIFLALIILSIPALDYSGLCFSKGYWLSDKEKIRLAASAVANSGPQINYIDDYMRRIKPSRETDFRNFELEYSTYHDPQIWKAHKDGSSERVSLADVDKFMEENPNCCKIVDRITPYYSYGYSDVVQVKYSAKFYDKSHNVVTLKDYTEIPTVDNCGQVDTLAH